MTDLSPGATEFVLALADDKHLMGQQHAEWIGVAPFLEEDLAFCSIGQDELGHAALLYELLVDDDDAAIDALAFRRGAAEYRSCALVEQPMPDWAQTLVRHWLFDEADRLRWQLLADSSLAGLAAIAARVEREEAFHRRHANGLLDVLLDDDEAGPTIATAAQIVAPLATSLFDPVGGEADAIAEGITAGAFADHQSAWQTLVEGRVGSIEWHRAPAPSARSERTAHFEPLMARMCEVLDLDPSATW